MKKRMTQSQLANLNKNGRPKGSKNKFTLVKEAIVSCFDVKEMKNWKKGHYTDYFRGIISLLPKELGITGADGKQFSITVKVEKDDGQNKGDGIKR